MNVASGGQTVWRVVAWPIVAAVALHLGLMVKYVVKHGGDPCSFVNVGRTHLAEPPYAAITASFSREGYDGQYYYVLARNPWKRHDQGIDAPPIRHLRLLYPAACWLLSGGRHVLLIWVMPLINLAAIAGLAGLGAWLAHRHGATAWWGLGLPLMVTAVLPALRDLTDAISTLAVCGLFTAWVLRARGWVVVVWSLAALFAREQNLALVVLLTGLSGWERRYRLTAGLALVLGVWLAWVSLLRTIYGVWPFLPGEGNLGLPLTGLVTRWSNLITQPYWSGRIRLLHMWSMVNLTLQFGLAIYLLAARRCEPVVSLLLGAAVLLAATTGSSIYEDCWSYTRVLVWLPLGIWFACIQGRQYKLLALLAPTVGWAVYACLRV